MPTRTPDGLMTLSSDELRQFAVDALLQHVQLHINGKKCTLETVYELILKASAAQTSISDVCDDSRARRAVPPRWAICMRRCRTRCKSQRHYVRLRSPRFASRLRALTEGASRSLIIQFHPSFFRLHLLSFSPPLN